MHTFNFQVNNSEPGKLLVYYNPKHNYVTIYWKCPLRPQLLIDGAQCTLDVVEVGTCPMKYFIDYYGLMEEIPINKYEEPVFFYIGLNSATLAKVACHGEAIGDGYESTLSSLSHYITQAISFLENNLTSDVLNAVDDDFNKLISSLSGGSFTHAVTRENSFNNLILVYLAKYAGGCIDKKDIHILLICLSVIQHRANDLIAYQNIVKAIISTAGASGSDKKKIRKFDPYNLKIISIPIKSPEKPQDPKIMSFVGANIDQSPEEISQRERVMEELEAREQPTLEQAPQAIVTLGGRSKQQEVLAIEPARVPAQQTWAAPMAGDSSRSNMNWRSTNDSQTYTPMPGYTAQKPRPLLPPFHSIPPNRPTNILPPLMPGFNSANSATTPTRSPNYFGGQNKDEFTPHLSMSGANSANSANSATTPAFPLKYFPPQNWNEFTLPPLQLGNEQPISPHRPPPMANFENFTPTGSQQGGPSTDRQTRAPVAVMTEDQSTPGSDNNWFSSNNTNTGNSPVTQSLRSYERPPDVSSGGPSNCVQRIQETIVVSTPDVEEEPPTFLLGRKAAFVASHKVAKTFGKKPSDIYGDDVDMSEADSDDEKDDGNDEDYGNGGSEISSDEAADEDGEDEDEEDSDDAPLATRRGMKTGSTRVIRDESVSRNTRQSSRGTSSHARGRRQGGRGGQGGHGRGGRGQGQALPVGLRPTTTHSENVSSSSYPKNNSESSPSDLKTLRGRRAKRSRPRR